MASCSDDCDQLHDSDIYGTPNVIKGSFPEGLLIPDLGDEITFAPELKDSTGATYSWIINGVEVSTDPKYTYNVEGPCRVNLTCKIKNDLGTAVLNSKIVSQQDFSQGFLFVDDKEVGFYHNETNKAYYNCFQALNYGSKITPEGTIMATQLDDKMYFMIKNSVTNYDHLIITDPQTLYKLNSINGPANLLCFIPLNERYVLLSQMTNASLLDIKTNQVTAFSKRLPSSILSGQVFNGKLFINTTYGNPDNICVYNVDEIIEAAGKEFPEPEEFAITQRGKSKFALGKDGNLYTTAYHEEKNVLVKIKPDLTTELIDLPFDLPKPRWSELYFRGVVASVKSNSIFIPADNGAIYRYTIGDDASVRIPFITSDENMELCGIGIEENSATGELYTFYQGETANGGKAGSIIIRKADGTVKKVLNTGEVISKTAIFVNK